MGDKGLHCAGTGRSGNVSWVEIRKLAGGGVSVGVWGSKGSVLVPIEVFFGRARSRSMDLFQRGEGPGAKVVGKNGRVIAVGLFASGGGPVGEYGG